MDNECIISTCSSFSNHKMYYCIYFELTLKQMGKKLKVSLKQFHGYLYAVIILQFCKHTVLSTSSGAGTNINAYVLRGEFNQTEFCLT